MKIDNNFYCSAGAYKEEGSKCYLGNGNGLVFDAGVCRKERCPHYHRKYPSLEQFREEYGYEYPDDGAVYELDENHWPIDRNWFVGAKKHCGKNSVIVCACTPFGIPDDNWRPQ